MARAASIALLLAVHSAFRDAPPTLALDQDAVLLAFHDFPTATDFILLVAVAACGNVADRQPKRRTGDVALFRFASVATRSFADIAEGDLGQCVEHIGHYVD